jgi:hypothetical protein
MSIPRHPNTICTHCHIKPIVGILYHCFTCRYKLCEICFRYDATCPHVCQAWKTPFQEQSTPPPRQQHQEATTKLISPSREFVNNQFNPSTFSFTTPIQSIGTNFSFNPSTFNQMTDLSTMEEDGGGSAMIVQNNTHDIPNPINPFSF